MTHNPLTTVVDEGGIWHVGIFFGLLFCTALFIYRALKPTIHPVLLLFGLYIIGRALFILEYPIPLFRQYHTAYQATAGQTVVEFVLISLAAFVFPKNYEKGISFFCWWEVLAAWGLVPGFMGQGSFSNAFLVLWFPFAPVALQVVTVATVLFHHGSTAQLMLLVQLVVWLVKQYWNKNASTFLLSLLPWLLLSLPGMFFIMSYHANGPMLDGSERLLHWQKYLSVLTENWKFAAFGIGPGSFMWSSFLIDKYEGDLFPMMHSDWLQILFELGLVGFVFALASFGILVWKMRRNNQVLCALFGMAAFAATYHPFRYFPSAFLCALIIKKANIKLTARNRSARR